MEWSGGRLPIIQGHEVYGEVIEVGENVTRVKKGIEWFYLPPLPEIVELADTVRRVIQMYVSI